MPYRSEKLKIPRHLDRRVKLSEANKADIIMSHKNGIAIRVIARYYGVSVRLIQFVLFPERQARCILMRKLRGGWRANYNLELDKLYKKKHRAYKHDLYKKGLL